MAVFTAWRFAMAFTVLVSILGLHGLSDSQCGIQYKKQALQHGRMTFLRCPLSAPVKWWRSTEQCGGFSDYSSECDSPSCSIYANSSYFYYCCTAATVNDVLSVGDEERRCFRIQVCVDVSVSHQGSTVAFFNEAVQIFVEMFSEPPPQQSTTIFLTHNTETQRLTDNNTIYNVASVGDARLVWQYTVQVPDLPSEPSEGILTFTANFEHENRSCGSTESVSYSIPVHRTSGPSTQPPILTTPEPHTEGSPRISDSERNGYVAGLALACGLVIIFGLLSAGLIGYVVKRKWQKRSTDSSNNYGFGYGTSPGTTPTDGRPDYSRGISAASTTSTQPLIRNDYERNHPLTLAMSGALPDCNNNGHAPTTNNDNLNTPTPTAQSRLLPSTPDGVPAPASSNHTTMMATISEERVEPANLMPVYEHLPDGAPLELEGQQTDSSAVNV